MLVGEISVETRKWAKGALLAKLESAGVPASPINSIAEVFDDKPVNIGIRAPAGHRHAVLRMVVTGNVKDNPAIADYARIPKKVPDVLRAFPVRPSGDRVPVHQRPLAVGIGGVFPKSPDCAEGDNPQKSSHGSELNIIVPILGTKTQ